MILTITILIVLLSIAILMIILKIRPTFEQLFIAIFSIATTVLYFVFVYSLVFKIVGE